MSDSHHDCWLEIDLSWFQGDSLESKAIALLERLGPLWSRDSVGTRGLILCVGWLLDSVLMYNGQPDDPIPSCNGPTYERWTYRRLHDLVAAIRTEATAHGLPDLAIGMLLHGAKDMSVAASYDPALRKGRTDREDDQYAYNIKGTWFDSHPEVADPRFDHHFWFGSHVELPSDERIWRGDARPTFGEYFAAKLAAMTAEVGLDTVVFRDCMFTSNADGYRGSPTMPPPVRKAWTDSIVDMLTALKSARPDLTTIGYSGYTGQMLAWRATGFDLETVARSGKLDVWITQTWASAFQDYWRSDTLGYTPALLNVLTDLVMLSDTPTRHVFLIETLDAWEPFLSIRDFPGKIDWLVQALGHACVFMPGGRTRRSSGYYVSWMNRGAQLVSEHDVGLLTESTDTLARDLGRSPRPLGPCLVYDRESIESLLDHPVAHDRGEIVDTWCALLAKFGMRMLSATRAQWLPEVEADGFVYACPATPSEAVESAVRSRLDRGVPFLLVGQTDTYSESLRRDLDVECEGDPPVSEYALAAEVAPAWVSKTGSAAVVLNQRRRSMASSPSWSAILTALQGPVLARHATLPCWVWEPPAWPGGWEYNCESVQSPQAFWLVAEATGAGWGAPRLRNDRMTRPCCALSWEYDDGAVAVLLGNLENGIFGNSAHPVTGLLSGADDWQPVIGAEHVRLSARNDGVHVLLAGHQRALLVADRLNSTTAAQKAANTPSAHAAPLPPA